jgi:hypothetical protein
MREVVRRVARKVGVDLAPDETGAGGRAEFVGTVLPKGGVGAEVGVHKGFFTPVLLEVAEPRRLHIIDPWYVLGREWNWGAGDRSTVNALARIMKRFEAELAEGRLVLHIGDDLEVLPRFEPGTFDWMYFDTTHAYEQTCKELRLAEALVKPDGVICGDDWRDDPAHAHYGVRVAVEEFCAERGFRLAYASAADRQWAVRRA